jgi:Flp pilus assembly protein TadG
MVGDKMKTFRNLVKNERGQSAVEFALVLPILIIILLGIIEFGWFLNAKITITSAAREGARVYAIHGGDPTTVGSKVNQAVANTLSSTTVHQLSGSPFLSPITPGTAGIKMAEVTVTGKVSGITGFFSKPFMGFFNAVIDEDNTLTMSSKASMRVEFYSP